MLSWVNDFKYLGAKINDRMQESYMANAILSKARGALVKLYDFIHKGGFR